MSDLRERNRKIKLEIISFSDRNRLKPENAEKLLFLHENLPKIQFHYDLKDKEQPQDDTNI